jgi:hypothetical protein
VAFRRPGRAGSARAAGSQAPATLEPAGAIRVVVLPGVEPAARIGVVANGIGVVIGWPSVVSGQRLVWPRRQLVRRYGWLVGTRSAVGVGPTRGAGAVGARVAAGGLGLVGRCVLSAECRRRGAQDQAEEHLGAMQAQAARQPCAPGPRH